MMDKFIGQIKKKFILLYTDDVKALISHNTNISVTSKHNLANIYVPLTVIAKCWSGRIFPLMSDILKVIYVIPLGSLVAWL